jgi:hypothetical protein
MLLEVASVLWFARPSWLFPIQSVQRIFLSAYSLALLSFALSDTLQVQTKCHLQILSECERLKSTQWIF